MKVEKKDIDKLLISKDIEEIRAFLNNCLLWNASDVETIRICVSEFSKINGVFDKHDNSELKQNKEGYSNEYLIDVNTELTFNFSKERYLHALEVANYLEMKKNDRKRDGQASKSNFVDMKVEENKKKNSPKYTRGKKQKSSLGFQIIVGVLVIVLMIILIILLKNILLR